VLTSLVVSIVKACTRFAPLTVLIALTLAIAAGFYTTRHFAINTDINTLISPDLDWRKRDNQFEQAFDRERTILTVVDAPTPEFAGAANAALEQKLSGDTRHFESVQPLGGSSSSTAPSGHSR
jgi:predicted RND superfamily exporter protein